MTYSQNIAMEFAHQNNKNNFIQKNKTTTNKLKDITVSRAWEGGDTQFNLVANSEHYKFAFQHIRKRDYLS